MKYRFLIIALTLGLCVTACVHTSIVWASEKEAAAFIEQKQLNESIHAAADYLIRQCRENGKFRYRINLNKAVKLKPRYNLLRHAGTIYALASYDQAYTGELTRSVLKRSTQFLKKTAIGSVPGRDDLLAVWSHPDINLGGKPLQAKLGGTGIGLVALLSVEKRIPGTTPLEYLRQMGEFLIYMQKKDGSFYSKYIPQKGGRDDSWTSLYYPGEAALGLVMLYERDPAIKWLQAAADGIAFLAKKRAEADAVEADHWALLATARMLPLYDRCRQPIPRQSVIKHAVQICESMLKDKPANYDSWLRNGSFTADGRTTPTAIRLEGLLGALGFLPVERSYLRRQIIFAISEGMQFLLRSQIQSGEHTGGIPRAIQKLPKDHPQWKRSFNRRATEVRIDYVQHALSAMLAYERMSF